MNISRKTILAAALTAVLSVLSAGAALATSYYPYDVSSLETYLTSGGATFTTHGALSGDYEFRPLAFEAADSVQFRSGTTTLFTNQSLSTEFGTKLTASASTINFMDTDYTSGDKTTTWIASKPAAVKVYELTKDWTALGLNGKSVFLSAHTLIFGLNDKGSTDGDFDDFILSAKKIDCSPTPIPGAVWLLGSGLLGVLGFNRSRKSETAAQA